MSKTRETYKHLVFMSFDFRILGIRICFVFRASIFEINILTGYSERISFRENAAQLSRSTVF